jgi:hypothetical protein
VQNCDNDRSAVSTTASALLCWSHMQCQLSTTVALEPGREALSCGRPHLLGMVHISGLIRQTQIGDASLSASGADSGVLGTD